MKLTEQRRLDTAHRTPAASAESWHHPLKAGRKAASGKTARIIGRTCVRFSGCSTVATMACVLLLLVSTHAAAQVAVSTVFVDAVSQAGEPILNLNGSAAYPVSTIYQPSRIEVDGTVIVSEGDAVALIAGATWASTSFAGFSDSGRLILSGFLDGTDPDNDFATVMLGGGLAEYVLFQKGITMAPGTSGHLSGVSSPRISGSGRIAFRGGVVETGAAGVWAGMPGALAKLALAGEPAQSVPGATYSNEFYNTGRNPLAMNSSGLVAFVVSLEGPGIDTSNDKAVYRGTSGSLTLIAREGNPVTGGGTYGDLHEPSIGPAGRVAFYDGSAVYLDGARIAKIGDPAPRGGTIEGLSFPAIDGAMAFRAEVHDDGTYLDSYMMLHEGQLVEVIREGDEAPGTGGDVFTVLSSNAVVNACGQIAFLGRITGDRRGLWVIHREGNGFLVALVGTASPVGPNYSSFTGFLGDGAARCNISDNGWRYFNHSGQLLFRASLSDGKEGVFRSAPLDLPCDALLFADGFETGDSSGWSTVQD